MIGAGGIRPVSTGYLGAIRESVRQAGGLYISDEVITGFGRVGDWFAANKFGLEPDLMTFAKGVTCGYAPLGGVVAAPHVAEPFFDTPGLIFRHGYTYSGHPLAAAAGWVVAGTTVGTALGSLAMITLIIAVTTRQLRTVRVWQARAIYRGTVTVIVCSPERIRCICT